MIAIIPLIYTVHIFTNGRQLKDNLKIFSKYMVQFQNVALQVCFYLDMRTIYPIFVFHNWI